MLNKLILLSSLCLFLFFLSCKKHIEAPDSPEIPVESKERTEEQLLKDSIYYYYKLNSLWEKSIPKYEDISKFTDSLSSTSSVLNTLKLKTPAFPVYASTGGTYDRFSYFTELNNNSRLSATLRMDNNDGYGISFALGAISDTIAYPFINMVEGGSPADLASIVRSDMVLELNGLDMKINVDCSSGTCQATDQNKYNAVIASLRNSLRANSMNIKLEKKDESIKTHVLDYRTYEVDPLLADTVFKFSNMNVGYFAYSSFEQIENNNTNQKNIDELFDKFEENSIKALIVDLRYNGGGYVDAAVYMADKIVNSIGKDKLMLKYEVNDHLKKEKNTPRSRFDDVYFKKNNELNLETVCFIVSDNTASAAEMLINVLKPYMNVKMVAEGSKTYGKPVGFFPDRIMNSIELWVTSFALQNANGSYDYWLGLNADKQNVSDYIFVNFADRKEKMIAEALTITGAIETPSLKASRKVTSFDENKTKMKNVTQVVQKGALKTNRF